MVDNERTLDDLLDIFSHASSLSASSYSCIVMLLIFVAVLEEWMPFYG